MISKKELENDLLAFADDESNVEFDVQGTVIFVKGGYEYIFKVCDHEGSTFVEYQDNRIPYRTFIAKEIAKLDLFAKKIVERRKSIENYVDGLSILKTAYKGEEGTALTLLGKECDNFLEFGSKVVFITADAGHGKTVLLKQFQHDQAEKYLKGQSNYLFWHVDLLGRNLVRLPEAIMFDLGELRISGLYYPSILNLIQKRLIILAIDGFDELAAEIGGINALSSLSSFVKEMEGRGTLVAASRRTFFDTQDYLKRNKLIKANIEYDIEFDEIKLKDWTRKEVEEYLKPHFDEPNKIYDSLLEELHDQNNPILTRPFLLAKIVEALNGDEKQISSFFERSGITKDGVSIEGVSMIVEKFTKREVEKWRERDTKTGKPYLTFEQHIKLLAVLSREMWELQKDTVNKEEIEFYTTVLLEQWKVDEEIKPIILRLAVTHAFLIPVSEQNFDIRKFDHEEFKNYFLSRALADLLNETIINQNLKFLKKFLYVNQLPDSVAMYCFNYVDNIDENAIQIINLFDNILNEEWKPSYLQVNIGTLIPFAIDKIDFQNQFNICLQVNYTSLIFENKSINNVCFENGNFINISFRNTQFENLSFLKCKFNEIKFETSSENIFKNVKIINSEVHCLIVLKEGEITETVYSPIRIKQVFDEFNIEYVEDESIFGQLKVENPEFKKLLTRFILRFNKTFNQYEKNILEERYYGPNTDEILEKVIPLLEKYGIIDSYETKKSKQAGSRVWKLNFEIEEILSMDGIFSNDILSHFWNEVNSTI